MLTGENNLIEKKLTKINHPIASFQFLDYIC